MNRRLLIMLLAILALFSAWFYLTHPPGAKIKIDNHELTVEMAVTTPEKVRGLGGRATLAPDHGMLFVYDHKEPYEFWMKDMQFPLDFIWIEDKTVADITLNVPPPAPGANPAIVKPYVAVDKILEVNAGTVARLGVKRGDKVDFITR